MQVSKEQIEKASAATSAEELLAMAKADGIELTEEDAKHYYDVLHEELLSEEQLCTLSEEELANVAGGSQCKGGKTYSSDFPYYLIVTSGNRCKLYEDAQLRVRLSLTGTCGHCFYCEVSGMVLYCSKRTIDNDPLR